MPDQQRIEWERFVREQHAEGFCDASGLRAGFCVRSICDCFETSEGAAAIERGECTCSICRVAVPPATTGDHPVTEYGTTRCPVERVAAEIDDDGECSACGAVVVPPARGDQL